MGSAKIMARIGKAFAEALVEMMDEGRDDARRTVDGPS